MKINNEVKMIVGIVVVCILLLVAFVKLAPTTPGGGQARDLALLVHDDSNMTGKKDAKVTLVEFGDYQCPACATVAPFVKGVVDSYKTNPDFNFVFRNFPLSQHANAIISAEVAQAAGAQNKYFEMSELIYKNQDEWDEVSQPIDLFVGYAKSLGLDTMKFKADLDQHKFVPFIQADLQDSISLALDHTPTFFLNGIEVTDLGSLKSQIDSLLVK
jgi:protein-disulfide isomerase